MVDFTKHVGRNKNGTRLVVVFREIPDDEEHCLVVETDSLSDMYHDQLLQEVDRDTYRINCQSYANV